ncbi:MAG: methyltransferase domain-containing protein [Chthonomonadales bacterium]
MKLLKPIGTLVALFALAIGPQLAHSQEKQPKPQVLRPKYEPRDDHDPDGIGIFYMDREIAQVMGHQAADWLDRPEREKEEAPTLLVKSLRLKPGMVVADIGAGSGYLSFKMAKFIAPGGKVYAEDIQQEMLDIVKSKAKLQKVTNVVPWMGTVTDPKLPASSVDLMIMVDVYHEFDHPYEMIQNMVKCLKKGGRIAFVEYRKEDESVPIKPLHKMSEKQVKKEMALFPLKWAQTIHVLPRQHIIIFEKI